MGDFFQAGDVTTLHRLGTPTLDRLESRLMQCSQARPIALVLPSLYSELAGPALATIVKELQAVTYLRQVVVTLGPCVAEEFTHAKRFFRALPQETTLVWNSGPRLQAFYTLLRDQGLEVGKTGKGQSAWMAYGYILACNVSKIIALHDCDIVSYDRELLARLVYPVADPVLDYEFCKGYYSRVTDRMHGRVTRLFMTPVLRAMIKLLGPLPFLTFLASFRYILAGEFAMIADLARLNRIPPDWGLEVGVLAEIYRNCSTRRVCQAAICENYEHKHQSLSPDDPETGLMKMCVDIAKSLFRSLASDGVVLSQGFFNSLQTSYVRQAQDLLAAYGHDAAINGLVFDRHEEALALEAFARGLRLAGDHFMVDPLGVPLISNWNRVLSAIPDFFDQLRQAVDEDNR